MARIVRSTVRPEPVYVDAIRHGAARLLCRWDIHEIEIADEGGTRTEYEYIEQVIDDPGWVLDSPAYLTRQNGRQALTDAGRQYFADHAAEILRWAQAAGV